MQDYIDEDWKGVLQSNGFMDFDRLWQLDTGWFEPPNRRRGGWSGISQTSLKKTDGSPVGVFIKRQENHVCKSPRHPIRGELTFARELHNLLLCKKYRIPTPSLIYHGERQQGHDRRAILMTVELSGFVSLQDWVDAWQQQRPSPSIKKQVIEGVARVLQRLHRHRLQHNCLYPKHVFIKVEQDSVDVRLIDLEKTKQRWRRKSASQRDLDTLNRHAPEWSRTDRMRFLLAYVGRNSMDYECRALWRELAALQLKKMRKASQA